MISEAEKLLQKVADRLETWADENERGRWKIQAQAQRDTAREIYSHLGREVKMAQQQIKNQERIKKLEKRLEKAQNQIMELIIDRRALQRNIVRLADAVDYLGREVEKLRRGQIH